QLSSVQHRATCAPTATTAHRVSTAWTTTCERIRVRSRFDARNAVIEQLRRAISPRTSVHTPARSRTRATTETAASAGCRRATWIRTFVRTPVRSRTNARTRSAHSDRRTSVTSCATFETCIASS
ncbi:gastrula zinc finger protein XlCGF57.1-like, partial [Aphelenchoides avenae]